MNKIYYMTLLILVMVNYAFAINPPPYYVTICENPAPGYLFMTNYEPGQFNITDNSGQPIFVKKFDNNIMMLNLRLLDNGLIGYFYNSKFYLMNDFFELVDSFGSIGDYWLDFHDCLILPDNHKILIATEQKIMDMSVIVQGGQKDALIIGNVIQEIDENNNLVFQWKSLDHFNITDVVNEFSLTQPSVDACHTNAIHLDKDGNLILSNREIDEITKIDRKTGDVIWRMGGTLCKNNQFTFINDTEDDYFGFSHQHSVSVLPNGNILLFDNGNMKPRQYSRVVEYKINESNKTVEKVWEYKDFPNIASTTMGSAQRLPNGNTLIGWGSNNRNLTATEVRSDGTKVFELVNYQNYAVYKIIYKSDAVTKFINNPGTYIFSDDKYNTDISFDIDSQGDVGNIWVEKHYYQPIKMEFFGQIPYQVYNNRWTVYSDSIKEFSATIKFYIGNDSTIDPEDARIYFRANEGKGDFYMLETTYNLSEKTLKTEIKGFGEFVICSNPSILPPIAIYPQDSSYNIVISPTISWQAMSMASKYNFQLSKNNNFTQLVIDSINIQDPSLECDLDYNTPYFWHVKAFYGTDKSPWSKTYMFITQPKDLPVPPILLYPQDKDTSVPLRGNLQWEKVPGVVYYNIEMALDPDFHIPILLRSYISSNYLIYNDLIPGRSHYWHVASSNGYYYSPWSSTCMFNTADDTLNMVEYKNGEISIIQQSNRILFEINGISAGSFNIYLFDIMGNPVGEVSGYHDSYQNNPIELEINSLNSGIYFYRIISNNKIECGKILIDK